MLNVMLLRKCLDEQNAPDFGLVLGSLLKLSWHGESFRSVGLDLNCCYPEMVANSIGQCTYDCYISSFGLFQTSTGTGSVLEQKSSWSKRLSTGWFATLGHSKVPHFGNPSAIFGKRARKVYSISLRIFT